MVYQGGTAQEDETALHSGPLPSADREQAGKTLNK